MATFGNSAPSSNTINYDAVFTSSLSNYRAKLNDVVSKSHAFYYELKNNGGWDPRDGGTYVEEQLMYELGTADWYDGYDVLNTDPMDGITKAIQEWRQLAVPVTISRKEERQNSGSHRIFNLLKTKIKQAEMGIIDKFSTSLLQGAGSGSLMTPSSNNSNGAIGIDPIGKLIQYDPTVSNVVCNINQSTHSWWRNRTKTSAATTYGGLLAEFDNMYNTCSRGPGGPPKLILVDQTTFELINAAYYAKYQTQMASDGNYPFENLKFRRAKIVMDENVPNVYAGTTDTTTTTGGTAYFLNMEFFKVIPDSQTQFINTPFVKPTDQDAKLAHILWMGNTIVSNRKKSGVIGKIARTLTVS